MTTSLVAAARAQSVWLLAQLTGDNILLGANFNAPVQTGPQAPVQSALDFSPE